MCVCVCVSVCVCVCVSTHIFMHSSVSGHLGCFHILAAKNSAAVNIQVHVSFQISALAILISFQLVRIICLEGTKLLQAEADSSRA